MTTFTRQLLSGSTSGRPIPIVATATAGTLLHTAVAGATGFSEVYLWVSNTSASPVPLTIEWGGATDPGDHLVKAFSIPPNSPPLPIAVGQVLNGGLSVRAFAGTTGVLNAVGYVNLIA